MYENWEDLHEPSVLELDSAVGYIALVNCKSAKTILGPWLTSKAVPRFGFQLDKYA